MGPIKLSKQSTHHLMRYVRSPWHCWDCWDGCACKRSMKVVLAGPTGLGGGYMVGCCCCSCSILGLAVFACGDSAGVNSIAKATVLCWNCRQLVLGILRVKLFSHVKKLSRSRSRMPDDVRTRWFADSFITVMSSP